LPVKSTYKAGAKTDRGLVREQNEDAVLSERKVEAFGVIDGMGGHAGGKMAAELALDAIKKAMKATGSDAERRVRTAIAQANQAIFEGRDRHPEYREMACVLTIFALDRGRAIVGHVGDTRLYKIRGAQIEQVTHDHSPVGELVRAGRLTEEDAMRHPNRNLVLRDVGSTPRGPDEPNWIDVYRTDFEPDAALIVASDGLTDQVPPADVLALTHQFAGQPVKAAEALVERSNRAGGKDNVSVVVLMGPQFTRANAPRRDDSTERLGEEDEEDNTARPARRHPAWRWLGWLVLAAVAGLALGWWVRRPVTPVDPAPPALPDGVVVVDAFGPEDARHFKSLEAALAQAAPGTIIELKAGVYAGPFRLRNGIALRGQTGVTLRGDASLDAVLHADKLTDTTTLTGLTIDAAGAARGLYARASNVAVRQVKFLGARDAAVQLEEGSTAQVEQSSFTIPTGAAGVRSAASTVDVKDNSFVCAYPALKSRPTEFLNFREHRITNEGNRVEGCDPPARPVPLPAPKKAAVKKGGTP